MAEITTKEENGENTVVRLEHVSYRYPRTKNYVLHDVCIDIHQGEFIAVMGENGAGKTTFLSCLNSIIPNYYLGHMQGNVKVYGMDTKEHVVSEFSRKVGMVLEDPESQLFTTYVRNEVAFSAENMQVDPDEIRRRIDWALSIVGLTSYKDRETTALSGGQKQRLAIAANLAMKPDMLVLDEPTSQLDPIGTREVFDVIRRLRNEEKMTVVIATHKSEEIAEFADKVLVFSKGHVVAFDEPRKIFQDEELMKLCHIRPPQVSALVNYMNMKNAEIHRLPILLKEAGGEIEEWYSGGRKDG